MRLKSNYPHSFIYTHSNYYCNYTIMCMSFRRMFGVNQLFINILLVVILSTAQTRSATVEENTCTSKSKCNECIETPSCAWYFEPEESFGNRPRCYQPDTTPQHENYSAVYQFMPTNQLRILSNQPLNSSYDNMDRIQVSPQKVEVKLRTGNSYGFGFQYEQMEDYPVDLYFLMDLSTSMRDERQKMTLLGNQLLSTLQNISSNLHVGIGSYVHGIVKPNASKLNSSCTNCAPLQYGFRNEMGLSKNFNRFSDILEHPTVSNEISSSGYELDIYNALTQAMICTNQIGWRLHARKILVVVTNDDVLNPNLSITKFNNYLCHLGNDGIYNWTTFSPPEHPNITKLSENVRRQAVNILFAVTDDHINSYETLSYLIDESSVGTFTSDSSNIEELVKQYVQMSSVIEIKDNANHEINYYSKCSNPVSDEKETNICSGVKTGQVIDFRLEIYIKECPKDRKKWKETIEVYAVQNFMNSQTLIIDLEMFCSCPEDFF